MWRRTAIAVCLLALILVAGWTPAQASLTTIGTADIAGVGTGYNLIYDNASPFGSIVWLDYTRGLDSWHNQVSWASGLNALSAVTYHLNSGLSMNWGGSSWRLPSTVDAPGSFAYPPPVGSSEMAHLYYAEGVTGTSPAPFANLQPSTYWSGTEYALPSSAWEFGTVDGRQYMFGKNNGLYALAVRPGQLETSAVPEPSTYLLLGIALGVVGYARRRMSAR